MTFHMWSLFHYVYIASPFLFACLFYYLFKGCKEKTLRAIGIGFSLIGIALLVGRNIEIYQKTGEINPEIIPFQICHIANFILLFAFLKESKVLFATLFCFHFPTALLSIIFANSLTNYSTILTWQGMAYVWGHMLIVGVILWAYLNQMIKMNFRILIKSLWTISILFLLSIFVNNLFMKWMPTYQSNYFYTMVPEKGTPLELIYKMGKELNIFGIHVNPIYIFGMFVGGYAVVFLFYALYKLLEFIRRTSILNQVNKGV